MSIVFAYRPELIAEVIKKGASQQEQYMELLDFPDDGASSSFGSLITTQKTWADKKLVYFMILLFKKIYKQPSMKVNVSFTKHISY